MICQMPQVNSVMTRCKIAVLISPLNNGTHHPKNKYVQLNPKYPFFVRPLAGLVNITFVAISPLFAV